MFGLVCLSILLGLQAVVADDFTSGMTHGPVEAGIFSPSVQYIPNDSYSTNKTLSAALAAQGTGWSVHWGDGANTPPIGAVPDAPLWTVIEGPPRFLPHTNATQLGLDRNLVMMIYFDGVGLTIHGSLDNVDPNNQQPPLQIEQMDALPTSFPVLRTWDINKTENNVVWQSPKGNFTFLWYMVRLNHGRLNITGFTFDYAYAKGATQHEFPAVSNGRLNTDMFNVYEMSITDNSLDSITKPGNYTITKTIGGVGGQEPVPYESLQLSNTSMLSIQVPPNTTMLSIHHTYGPDYAVLEWSYRPSPPLSDKNKHGAGITAQLTNNISAPAMASLHTLDPTVSYNLTIGGYLTDESLFALAQSIVNVKSIVAWTIPPNGTAEEVPVSQGDPESQSSSSHGMSSKTKAIIGGVVGGVGGFLLLLGLGLLFCWRRRRTRVERAKIDPMPVDLNENEPKALESGSGSHIDETDAVPELASGPRASKMREAFGHSAPVSVRGAPSSVGAPPSSAALPPRSVAGSAVPSSVLVPGTQVGYGAASAVPSSAAMPSGGRAGSPTGSGFDTETWADGMPDDTTASSSRAPISKAGSLQMFAQVNIQQEEDAGSIEEHHQQQQQTVVVPPSYNPAWADRRSSAVRSEAGGVSEVISSGPTMTGQHLQPTSPIDVEAVGGAPIPMHSSSHGGSNSQLAQSVGDPNSASHSRLSLRPSMESETFGRAV